MMKTRHTLALATILKFAFFFLGFLMCFYANAQQKEYESPGIVGRMPVFYQKLADRQQYPLSWLKCEKGDFSIWRTEAKAKVMECLMTPPPAVPFDAKIIAEQDRGTYVARKIVFNVTGDSRVLAFMLVPKSKGPHPAVLLLHDHGAKYDIGKEKVIEPWDEPAEKIKSAKTWAVECYGGKFIGDELAKKGYVCFATDMLNWSDRGGAEDDQQAVASNLYHMGVSFAGLIVHEDLRAAEFLSQQPEVDPKRIASMGLSVGGYRTWHSVALSDHIAAGVSVCWMTTYKGIIFPNSIESNGIYTMLHPGLANFLDYPDIAAIACPKPLMFCCGSKDHLFPVKSINEAFDKMRKVWVSQGAGDKLITKLYDLPHQYSIDMQNEAFEWLDKVLLKK